MSAHAATEPELPVVSVSTADTVVLELTPSDAQALARILAHYDLITGWHGEDGQRIPTADGFDREVWQHTLIRLVAEAQNARLQITAPHGDRPLPQPRSPPMTATVTIEVNAELHATIADCIAARDEGMAQAQEADRSGWNRALINQAIDAFAGTGQRFSANDVRVLLPEDLPGPLFGAQFSAAQSQGRIRFVGFTRSTKKNTHGKPVAVWVGRAQA